MKKSKICPKCESDQVFTNEDKSKRGERANLPVTNWRNFSISTYACMDCGYIEEYLSKADLQDTNTIEKLKDNWEKA
jgi:predicted nucleic-acid-binding Zn-ribbon protein